MAASSTNTIIGVERFLAAWTVPSKHSLRLPLREGAAGQRNLSGGARDAAVVFPRGHPQFVDALEDGVRALVVLLIDELDCVTFSSCEGHAAEDGQTLLWGRSVDILPRDAAEGARLRAALRGCIDAVPQVLEAPVRLQLVENEVETELGTLPAMTLDFTPETTDAATYFAGVAPLYAALLAEVKVVNP
jgi:uncharacterized protein